MRTRASLAYNETVGSKHNRSNSGKKTNKKHENPRLRIHVNATRFEWVCSRIFISYGMENTRLELTLFENVLYFVQGMSVASWSNEDCTLVVGCILRPWYDEHSKSQGKSSHSWDQSRNRRQKHKPPARTNHIENKESCLCGNICALRVNRNTFLDVSTLTIVYH